MSLQQLILLISLTCVCYIAVFLNFLSPHINSNFRMHYNSTKQLVINVVLHGKDRH